MRHQNCQRENCLKPTKLNFRRKTVEQKKLWDKFFEKHDKEMDELFEDNRKSDYVFLSEVGGESLAFVGKLLSLPLPKGANRNSSISSQDTIDDEAVQNSGKRNLSTSEASNSFRTSRSSGILKIRSEKSGLDSFEEGNRPSVLLQNESNTKLEDINKKHSLSFSTDIVKSLDDDLEEAQREGNCKSQQTERSLLYSFNTNKYEEDKVINGYISSDEECAIVEQPLDLKVHVGDLSFTASKKKQKKLIEERTKQKIVTNFLDASPKKAAVWRTSDNSSVKFTEDFAEMTLSQKAEYVEDVAATHFISWYRSLGGKTSALDKKTLKELFQIGIVSSPAQAVERNVVEKWASPSPNDSTVKTSHKDVTTRLLKRHLQWNMAAEKKPKKTYAFGTHMPDELRFVPPKKVTKKDWFECKTISKDLESFSTAFKDILHLRSVQEYCNFLSVKQTVEKPAYLVKQKMFQPRSFISKRVSSDKKLSIFDFDVDSLLPSTTSFP